MARFLNLQRMLDVNRGEAEQMGQKAVGSMAPELGRAEGHVGMLYSDLEGVRNIGQANAANSVGAAQAKLAMAGTQGGQAAMIGPGASALDSFLSGNSNAMGDTRRRFGGLMDRLKAGGEYANQADDAEAKRKQRLGEQQAAIGSVEDQTARSQAAQARRDAEERRKQYATYSDNVARSQGPGQVHNKYY